MIGGIAANNASGMCCGTAQNSYHTLAGLRVVLADGTRARQPRSRQPRRLRRAAPGPRPGPGRPRARRRATDQTLASRIRHKFRLKNTTGYSLNALVEFSDPVDILAHLMIGSEGTLGFISEITYHTVEEHAHKASALILFDRSRDRLQRGDAAQAHAGGSGRVARPRVAALGAGQARHAGVAARRCRPTARRCSSKRAPRRRSRCRSRSTPSPSSSSRLPLATPLRFTTDTAESTALWNVRKGMFPAVGAMRPTGTTVIIEDVAFPVERLADATLDLQRLLQRHGYPEAIIYGHALEGNLHFVFTQDFGSGAEVDRYSRFMDAVCEMVVHKYDGSLKAEHGTGRNMAPFVEMEWGAQAFAAMQRIKALFDPQGLLNPGVILNADPKSHLKNLKPLPAADVLVDKCIECGFCEPKCPSRGLTLSPRQRIVGWREIARLDAAGEDPQHSAELKELYDYQGIETCAACGLCATACPVGIETGLLIKALRGRRASPLAKKVAAVAATTLRRADRRRAARPGRRRPDARRDRHPRDEGRARRFAQGLRGAAAEVVAGARPAGELRAAVEASAARRTDRLLSRAAPRATWARSAVTTASRCCRWWPSGCSSAPASMWSIRRAWLANAAGSRSRARA